MITGRIPARLAIAANRHPAFLDDSGALAARELLVTFERSFLGNEDRELSAKLHDELPGIANKALAALRRLRANGGKFTIGAKGATAARELAESQSPALRFAKAHLKVTGDAEDFTPLDSAFERYEEWALAESLGARERRNRDAFKNDIIAALADRGVAHARRRWRGPGSLGEWEHGIRPRVRGFVGVVLKPDPLVSRDSPSAPGYANR
jgi:phage/plasmid-associated DNA primase